MRRTRTIGRVVVGALVLAACGSASGPSASSVAPAPRVNEPAVVAPPAGDPAARVDAGSPDTEPAATSAASAGPEADGAPVVPPPAASPDSDDVGAPVVPSSGRTVEGAAAIDLADHHRRLDSVEVATELVAVVDQAVDLAVRPGDDAMFVAQHFGAVVRVLGDDRRTVVDLSDQLLGHRDEQGLTGLEFSADGSTAWLHHTDASGRTQVSAMRVRADGSFDAATEQVVLEVGGPPGTNHNAGDLLRAPDGTLLVTLGDGEAAIRTASSVEHVADPHRTAHDPSTLRGSILRIRPTTHSGGDPAGAGVEGDGDGGPVPYMVPDDNPFAGGPLASADGGLVAGRPEVLSWGLRNPWKIDLDPESGALWIADVGGDEVEEINVAVPSGDRPAGWGVDFGWSRFEGGADRNIDVPTLFAAPVPPLHEYRHEGARCAISGGVVYRGARIPALWSGYVFADFCEGSVSVLDVTTGIAQRIVGADDGTGSIPGISGVRTGPDGELYVLSWFGEIHRLVPA